MVVHIDPYALAIEPVQPRKWDLAESAEFELVGRFDVRHFGGIR